MTYTLSNGKRIGLGLMALGLALIAAGLTGLIPDWRASFVVAAAFSPFIFLPLRDIVFDTIDQKRRLRPDQTPAAGQRIIDQPPPVAQVEPVAQVRSIPVNGNGDSHEIEVETSPYLQQVLDNRLAWRKDILGYLAWAKGRGPNAFLSKNMVGSDFTSLKPLNDPEAWVHVTDVMAASNLLVKKPGKPTRLSDEAATLGLAEVIERIQAGQWKLVLPTTPPPSCNLGPYKPT